MKKTGVMITVTAKGDFGYSPHFGQHIVKERLNEETETMVPAEYIIDEVEWNPDLFDRPSPEWLSIPEREALAITETSEVIDSPSEVAAPPKSETLAADKSPKPRGGK